MLRKWVDMHTKENISEADTILSYFSLTTKNEATKKLTFPF
jgi:hypothetical protein